MVLCLSVFAAALLALFEKAEVSAAAELFFLRRTSPRRRLP
jgi:hypothetical protein